MHRAYFIPSYNSLKMRLYFVEIAPCNLSSMDSVSLSDLRESICKEFFVQHIFCHVLSERSMKKNYWIKYFVLSDLGRAFVNFRTGTWGRPRELFPTNFRLTPKVGHTVES